MWRVALERRKKRKLYFEQFIILLLNKAFNFNYGSWVVAWHVLSLLIGYLVVTGVTEDIMIQAIGEHSQIISTAFVGIGQVWLEQVTANLM